MADENRVFDVARPGRSAPQPTAKPVIVGHHPMQSDPMVKEDHGSIDFGTEAQPTKISIVDDSPAGHADEAGPDLSVVSEEGEKQKTEETNAWTLPEPEKSAEPEPLPAAELTEPAPEPAPAPDMPSVNDTQAAAFETPQETHSPSDSPSVEEASPADGPMPGPEPPAADDAPVPEDYDAQPLPHVEALHFEPRHRGGRLKWLVLGLLILVIAAYLAIDAGLIASGVKLPFHIFSHSTPAPAATTTAQPASNQNTTAPVSNLPAGFAKYTLNGTDISFAAPSTWGVPNSATENGFSSRSASAKPDGVYAYVVTFPNNKDIQIAVTSSKFLPPARGAQYYDFLQWCTGTNDNKIYKSILNFTTSGGVDTPSTISCDQGPLADATKLDKNSIVQLKTKDASGAVLGDLYTKNLSESGLPVFRIKDASMTNSDIIKQILPTVKPAND